MCVQGLTMQMTVILKKRKAGHGPQRPKTSVVICPASILPAGTRKQNRNLKLLVNTKGGQLKSLVLAEGISVCAPDVSGN